MAKREYDPLSCIPSARAIQQRLSQVLEEARKLNVLLTTAEQLEAERSQRDAEREVRDDL